MKYRIKFQNIRNKLIMAMLFIIIVPNIFIMYNVASAFSIYLENILNKQTKQDMQKIDDLIDINLNILEDNVNFLANHELVKNSDNTIRSYINANENVIMTPSKNQGIEQQIYQLYSILGRSNSSLKYVYMGTENGSFIQWPEGYINKNYDPRKRPWYQTAIEHPGKTIVTDPYYYPAGDITVISIVKTIQNAQKEIIGVQAIDLSLEEITDLIGKIKIGQKGYLILVDNQGTIIADPKNPEMNFNNIKELNIRGLDNIKTLQNGIFEAKLDGSERVISIYTSEKHNFKLVSVIDKKEFLEQIVNVEKNIFIVIVICIIIAIIFAFLLSNKFSKPILIIKNHLNDLSYGDFRKKIPAHMLKRKDEFGNLSITLELMQHRLENLINEIKQSENSVKESFNFLQILMDTIPNPLFAKDEKGIYNHCNIAFTEYLGINKEKIIGHSVYDISDKELADVYYQADSELMQSKGKQTYEAKVISHDGTMQDIIFNKAAIINCNGQVTGLVGVMIDVTKERSNQEKLSKLIKIKEAMLQIGYSSNEIVDIKELLKLILSKVMECINIGNAGAILLIANNKLNIAVAEGYTKETIDRFNLDLEQSLQWIVTKGNITKTIIINNVEEMIHQNLLDTQDGLRIKSIISAPIIVNEKLYGFINLDSNNDNAFHIAELEIMEYVRSQLAITISKHKLYEETIYLSRYDKLTNLYNRSYFEQLVYTNIYESIKAHQKLSVVIFDLNGLKLVNDSYGHLAGDKLIETFAYELKKLGEKSDIIARFGGDEFIGVFYNRSLDSLQNSFESLIRNFQDNPIVFEDKEIICSFSYGFSSLPEDGEDFNLLIKIADERMYERKKIMKAETNE